MAPAKRKNAKETENKSANEPTEDRKSSVITSQPVQKSEKGMTCLNWLFVLVLLLGICSACVFAVYEEINKLQTKTNEQDKMLKNLLGKIESLKVAEPTEDHGVKAKLDQLMKADGSIENANKAMQNQIKNLEATVNEFNTAMFEVKQAQKSTQNTQAQIQANVEQFNDRLTNAEATVKHMKDVVAIADTNIKFITKDLMRVDGLATDIDKVLSKTQNEVITLYADYVKRQGMDEEETDSSSPVGDQDAVKEELAKVAMRVQLLEEQTAATVKRTHEEMTQFSGDISKIQRDLNDQMRDMSQQVSMDIQTSVQSILTQIENTPQKSSEMSTELEGVHKTIAQLSERVASLGNSGEIIRNLNKLSHAIIELTGKQGKMEETVSDLQKRSETQISVLTEHIKAIKIDDEKLRNEVAQLKEKH